MVLREKRLEQNISQKDMADKLQISHSALCMYEKGQRRIPVDVLLKMAQILNCSVDELLRTGEQKENSPGKESVSV